MQQQKVINLQIAEALGINKLRKEQISRSLFVTDISTEETLKTVSDFFSFCGNIEKIVLTKDWIEENKQIAIVIFETIDQFDTGLLVSFSTITDKTSPIKVQALAEALDFTPSQTAAPVAQPTPIAAAFDAQPNQASSMLQDIPVQSAQPVQQEQAQQQKKGAWWESVFGKENDVENPTRLISGFLNSGMQTGNKFVEEMKKDGAFFGSKMQEVNQGVKKSFDAFETKYQVGSKTKEVTTKTLHTAKVVADQTFNVSKELTRKTLMVGGATAKKTFATADQFAKDMEFDVMAKKSFETAGQITKKVFEVEPIKKTMQTTNNIAKGLRAKAMEVEPLRETIELTTEVLTFGVDNVKGWFAALTANPSKPHQQQLQQPQQAAASQFGTIPPFQPSNESQNTPNQSASLPAAAEPQQQQKPTNDLIQLDEPQPLPQQQEAPKEGDLFDLVGK